MLPPFSGNVAVPDPKVSDLASPIIRSTGALRINDTVTGDEDNRVAPGATLHDAVTVDTCVESNVTPAAGATKETDGAKLTTKKSL